MQDVTSFGAHGLLELRGRFPMGQRQVNHELLGQVAHFADTKVHVISGQLLDNLFGPPIAQKQSLAHPDQHVITDRAAGRS